MAKIKYHGRVNGTETWSLPQAVTVHAQRIFVQMHEVPDNISDRKTCEREIMTTHIVSKYNIWDSASEPKDKLKWLK